MPKSSNDPHHDNSVARVEAATRIQRSWRMRNKTKNKYLTSQVRWNEATDSARLQAVGVHADQGHNNNQARWRRAAVLMNRLQDGNNMLKKAGTDIPDATRKHLETQHWLELIDGKHRYGSNLKYYHKRWKEADTSENFFGWLDNGGGKHLDLKECPRQQLEKERITYLSAEQRLNYLVNVDADGKLRWARNNQLVDTTAGHWKDAGHGQGIIPYEVADAGVPQPPEAAEIPSRSSSSMSNAAMHYVGPPKGKNRLTRSLRKNFTMHGLVDKLMRKTVQRNTWIYVSDNNFNIFVGIKEPGTFQHSSFLAGGVVTSAGLISVKNGVIHTLSPLSGHYRTSIEHFHQFLRILDQKGIDMKKIHVSKAEGALWVIEHVGKGKKKQTDLSNKAKEKLSDAANSLQNVVSDTSWKREILEGRRRIEAGEDGGSRVPEG